MSHKSYLEHAEAAIAERRWESAYVFLEDGFVTENVANRERALALVKAYPQILAGGVATFSVARVVRMIEANGLVAGPRQELKRLEMYRVVATPEAAMQAEQNIAEAFAQVKKARDLEEFRKSQELARIEREKAEELARMEKARAEEVTRRAITARDREALALRMAKAIPMAKVSCKDSLECGKTFALTQIYILEHSKMKIQSANDTIIETYSPNDPHAIGARATKTPRSGTTALVSLDVYCGKPKTEADVYICMYSAVDVYEGFAPFIQRMLIK
ncbi:hypothetical protein [Hydrogenophaga sp. 2FB]|uniref:hypothetical protein n=1 Tax=Hydrogenophaga sp. 2FB TaxID=2502187 RepID=UPI0010F6E51D|nr:hypothetical protein [Hydrogenophaga sp. 2FB]